MCVCLKIIICRYNYCVISNRGFPQNHCGGLKLYKTRMLIDFKQQTIKAKGG